MSSQLELTVVLALDPRDGLLGRATDGAVDHVSRAAPAPRKPDDPRGVVPARAIAAHESRRRQGGLP